MQPTQKISKRRRQEKISTHVREILKIMGYDLRNTHLKGTPDRVAKIFMEELDLETLKKQAEKNKLLSSNPSTYNSMVILRNHKTQTRCPHHLERVELIIHVGYIPDKHLIGLSKLARIADYFSSGLMLQEEIADSIADGLYSALSPKGVGVCVIAEHGCIRCRGVRSRDSDVITSCLRGVMLEAATREEFLQYIKNH